MIDTRRPDTARRQAALIHVHTIARQKIGPKTTDTSNEKTEMDNPHSLPVPRPNSYWTEVLTSQTVSNYSLRCTVFILCLLLYSRVVMIVVIIIIIIIINNNNAFNVA